MIEEKPLENFPMMTTNDIVFGRRLKKIHVIDESKTYHLCINPWGNHVWETEANVRKAQELGLSLRLAYEQ